MVVDIGIEVGVNKKFALFKFVILVVLLVKMLRSVKKIKKFKREDVGSPVEFG